MAEGGDCTAADVKRTGKRDVAADPLAGPAAFDGLRGRRETADRPRDIEVAWNRMSANALLTAPFAL